MQSVTAFPVVDPVVNLRRSSIVGAVLGLASIAVSAALGHPLAGVFACVGLVLGAVNNRMLQRSVLQYAGAGAAGPADSAAGISKGRFRGGVLARLSGITVLAISVALLVRPDGVGIVAGLAVFQVLMLVGAALPVFRSLRPNA